MKDLTSSYINPYSYTNYYTETYFNRSKDNIITPIEKIISIRDQIRDSSKNFPSHSEIDNALTHAIKEIINLNKKIDRLQEDLNSSNENTIEIKIGDEIVVIDNDLATYVISAGVREYIIKAIESSLENQRYDE